MTEQSARMSDLRRPAAENVIGFSDRAVAGAGDVGQDAVVAADGAAIRIAIRIRVGICCVRDDANIPTLISFSGADARNWLLSAANNRVSHLPPMRQRWAWVAARRGPWSPPTLHAHAITPYTPFPPDDTIP